MGTLPMAYFNLDDNVWVQIGAAGIMITIVLGVWMVDFFMVGLNLDQLDVIGSNQSQLLGTVIFNFAFVLFFVSAPPAEFVSTCSFFDQPLLIDIAAMYHTLLPRSLPQPHGLEPLPAS
jgi:hypothetical protein